MVYFVLFCLFVCFVCFVFFYSFFFFFFLFLFFSFPSSSPPSQTLKYLFLPQDDPRLASGTPSIGQKLDPRIHFALVCGARSCPPIRVYRPSNLERGLGGEKGREGEGKKEEGKKGEVFFFSLGFLWSLLICCNFNNFFFIFFFFRVGIGSDWLL